MGFVYYFIIFYEFILRNVFEGDKIECIVYSVCVLCVLYVLCEYVFLKK